MHIRRAAITAALRSKTTYE